MRQADGNDVTGILEVLNETMHVGGGLRRRRAVIVGDENMHRRQ
jgi:hypothetical protein